MVTRLQEDLLKDLESQKQNLNDQIALLDPLAASIHRPAYKRLLSSGFSIFLEILIYVAALGAIAYAIFYNKLTPFYRLSSVLNLGINEKLLSNFQANKITWGIQGMAIVIAVLLFFIARLMSKIRQKDAVLDISAKNMKQLVQGNLKRRAALESLTQRYASDLPTDSDSIGKPSPPSTLPEHKDTSFEDLN